MRSGGSNVPDPQEAMAKLEEALQILDQEVAWRSAVSERLLAEVDTYIATISDTIGLRQQERLPRNVALYVATCNSGHRDISLYF